MNKIALGLALAFSALPAAADTKAFVSEAFSAGTGPYLGNSLTVSVSPGIVDLELGYDFGSDQDLVLYHLLSAAIGVWPGSGFNLRLEGSYGPRTSSTKADRGFFSLESGSIGGSIAWHPGHSGEVRPFLELGGSYDRYNIQGRDSAAAPGTAAVGADFSQESVRATAGVDVDRTTLRFGFSKFFYSQDASALLLPAGLGGGPSSLGAVYGSLPSRGEDYALRASVRQDFGEHKDWDATLGVTYGSYLDGGGSIVAGNLRIGHNLNRTVRVFLGVTAQTESLDPDPGRSDIFGTAGFSLRF